MKPITYTQIDVKGPMAAYQTVCGTKAYISSRKCTVIVSSNEDGRWHLSIAHRNRNPRWNEIRHARYEFVPNEIHMVMALPPTKFYVDIHPHSFHLWELKDLRLQNIIENG